MGAILLVLVLLGVSADSIQHFKKDHAETQQPVKSNENTASSDALPISNPDPAQSSTSAAS